jgi:hypothetical protein
VLTSNLGSFALADPTMTEEERRDAVLATVRTHFKPEFLNRLDDIVVFHALAGDSLRASVVSALSVGRPVGPTGPGPGGHADPASLCDGAWYRQRRMRLQENG